MVHKFNSSQKQIYKIKMKDQKKDINLFLPKFYSKQSQLSLTLNPLLKNIRQSKVSSYHQLGQLNTTHQHLNYHSSLPKQKGYVFQHRKLDKVDHLHKKKHSLKHKHLINQKISILDYESKQIQRKQGKSRSPNFEKFYQESQTIKSRNQSFNVRSKTSDQSKKQKAGALTSATGQISRNFSPGDFERGSFLFNNPESNMIEFDDEFYNYMKLKLLTKGPYFTGGKFSKIKKHLVQEINLEEIQKKFYKEPSGVTKYKDFFEKILQKRKQNKSQTDGQNKYMFSTISQIRKQLSTIGQKDKEDKIQSKYDFSRPSYSQNFDGQEFLHQVIRESCPDRKRKTSVKAKLFYKRSPLEGQRNQDNIILRINKNPDTILVTGEKKSFSVARNTPNLVSV